jgi:hypothetical protein
MYWDEDLFERYDVAVAAVPAAESIAEARASVQHFP